LKVKPSQDEGLVKLSAENQEIEKKEQSGANFQRLSRTLGSPETQKRGITDAPLETISAVDDASLYCSALGEFDADTGVRSTGHAERRLLIA
jgi:hypothetical protein